MWYAKCNTCDNKLVYKSKKAAKAAERHGRKCRDCKDEIRKAKLVRNCPGCGKTIKYKEVANVTNAERNNAKCKSCVIDDKKGEFYSGNTRNCPNCKKILTYSDSWGCTNANKNNTLCKPCSLKTKGIKPGALCIQNMIKANTGRVASEEEKAKRRKTFLNKYGSVSYLQSEDFKNKMMANGFVKKYFGKTAAQWSNESNVPHTASYKFFKENENASESDVRYFFDNFKENHTLIENIISNSRGIENYNKRFDHEKYPNLKYRPDFKLDEKNALNVDGLYWHSMAKSKDKKYHQNMRKEYESRGLRIFQFRADEVHNKLEIVNSILDNTLGLTKNKIWGRKTKVFNVSSSEAKIFLEENHIKGYLKSKHIGLYYNDTLVSIISYKTQAKRGYIKIDRFCSKIGYNVVGGFSKLMKYVPNPDNLDIHYWVDLRYGSGSFLLKQGYVLEKETLGFEWTDSKRTYNRLKCRANMDDRGLSEKEHSKELGWHRIYDAGQRLYVKKLKS